jgi:predicted nucleic acid-binding protein
VTHLIDTNVVSEQGRPAPEARVIAYLESLPPGAAYISAVTVGELHGGIVAMDEGRRKRELATWFAAFETSMARRVIPVDAAVAKAWAELSLDRKAIGREIKTADGLIAATARVHNLTIVTRNTKDFDEVGVGVVNPWEEPRAQGA